jgi:hypothetical protein
MTASWFEAVGHQLRAVADAFWGEVRGGALLPMLEPVAPFNRSSLVSPAVAVGGLIAIVLLSGMALAGLGAMMLALLGLYLVLVELFGLSVELDPLGAFATR